jgi:hypothetical protein
MTAGKTHQIQAKKKIIPSGGVKDKEADIEPDEST